MGDRLRLEAGPRPVLAAVRINGEYFPVEQMAERTATALLGVRIECAQCHKHPFDRWTQADYRAYANIFADVRFGLSPEGLAATARFLDERRKSAPGGALPPMPRLREVFIADAPARGSPTRRPAGRCRPGARRAGTAGTTATPANGSSPG